MSARWLALGVAALALAACETPGGTAATGGETRMASLPPGVHLPIDSAQALVGKNETEVSSLLGKPGFTRTDGPAQVWQYSGQSCALDVFMYQGTAGYKVEYTELRRLGSIGAVDDPTCLADALAGKKAKAS
ncbi:MAG: hypothetical protein ACM3N5_13275 [Candidatus Eiseniibacteriota bacterium]